jgi:hypothetical protein
MEVAQVHVERIERVDVANVLELVTHSVARDILLQYLDEPTTNEKKVSH